MNTNSFMVISILSFTFFVSSRFKISQLSNVDCDIRLFCLKSNRTRNILPTNRFNNEELLEENSRLCGIRLLFD
jgi:hypothetical protein